MKVVFWRVFVLLAGFLTMKFWLDSYGLTDTAIRLVFTFVTFIGLAVAIGVGVVATFLCTFSLTSFVFMTDYTRSNSVHESNKFILIAGCISAFLFAAFKPHMIEFALIKNYYEWFENYGLLMLAGFPILNYLLYEIKTEYRLAKNQANDAKRFIEYKKSFLK